MPIGSVDYITWRSVRGWAYDPVEASLRVDFFNGGRKIGSAKANEFRSDLKNANVGDGNKAFYFEIPEDSRGEKIVCKVGDFVIPEPDAATGSEYYRWRERRKQRLLAPLAIATGRGLEFGALHDPLIPPGKGIRYVDHASTPELRVKYVDDGTVDVREIVNVDYVWLDEPLKEIIADFAPIDFAAALHVGEHTPDLLGWLFQVRSVMRRGGIFSVALPDMRYCFDIARRLSTTADLVGAYLRKLKRPSPEALIDHFLHAVTRNGALTWYTWQQTPATTQLSNVYTLQEAFEIARTSTETNSYQDAHCWVFTAESFRKEMTALTGLGLFPFEIVDFYGPDGNEFIAILKAI